MRAHFHLQPSALGLVLLAIAAGSVVSLPLSGLVIARFESRRTVSAMAVLLAVGLATVAVGYLIGLAVVVAGLFVLGLANGAWDVAMNVHGAAVESHLDRSIMPRFHAGWSLGSVVGALVGVVMVVLGVPVTAHLAVVAILVAVAVPLATRRFISAPQSTTNAEGEVPSAGDPADGRRGALAAWREPRTLAIGVFVLAFAFAEGTGNDWISVASIDGYHVPVAVGTIAFATFLAAMTAGRWFAPTLLDRYGRVRVVRWLAVTASAGAALFVFGPAVPVAFAGVLLWGAGTSAGFPVGMSAGADDPGMAAGRVSVIASIGYCAFLAGPPLIGFLGNHLTVLRALTAVSILMALATILLQLCANGRRPRPFRAPDSEPVHQSASRSKSLMYLGSGVHIKRSESSAAPALLAQLAPAVEGSRLSLPVLAATVRVGGHNTVAGPMEAGCGKRCACLPSRPTIFG